MFVVMGGLMILVNDNDRPALARCRVTTEWRRRGRDELPVPEDLLDTVQRVISLNFPQVPIRKVKASSRDSQADGIWYGSRPYALAA